MLRPSVLLAFTIALCLLKTSSGKSNRLFEGESDAIRRGWRDEDRVSGRAAYTAIEVDRRSLDERRPRATESSADA
jgi:hypothetical protein